MIRDGSGGHKDQQPFYQHTCNTVVLLFYYSVCLQLVSAVPIFTRYFINIIIIVVILVFSFRVHSLTEKDCVG
ncbi:hypothetical protein PGB90_000173 [Kerria lacca]